MKWVAAKSGFDEMFGRGHTPRAHYAALISILESFTLEDVARRERLQRLALMNQGITFTVYGEKEGLERIFPFDFVPRIIPAPEWKLVQDGLVQRITTLNLKVVQTDVERGLILVEGAVPGAKGGWITVRDAVKKSLPKDAPKPGKFRTDGEAAAAGASAPNAETEAVKEGV